MIYQNRKNKFLSFLYMLLICISSINLSCNKRVNIEKEDLSNAILFTAYKPSKGVDTPENYNEIYLISIDNKDVKRITFSKKEEVNPVWIDDETIGFLRYRGMRGKPGGLENDLYIMHLIRAEEMELVKGYRKGNRYLPESFSAEDRKVVITTLYEKNFLIDLNDLPEDCYGLTIEQLLEKGASYFKEIPFIGELHSWSLKKELGVAIKEDTARLVELLGQNYGKETPEERGKWNDAKWKLREVAVFQLDSPNFKFITQDTFPDAHPEISPDGRYVVYSSPRPPYSIIYDTLNIPLIGQKVAKREEKNWDIFLIDLQNGENKRLTYSVKWDETSPTWAPDSKRIAFISDESGSDQIWIMDKDGSNKWHLTNVDLEKINISEISWSPE